MLADTSEPCGAHLTRQEWHEQICEFQTRTVTRDEARRQAGHLRFITFDGEYQPGQYELEDDFWLKMHCGHCVGVPHFPLNWNSSGNKTVRLTSAGELKDCVHYLAVSYRWADLGDDDKPPTYKVRTEWGERSNIAPNTILNRAICCAAERGIRLIWIDQECIRQDDTDPVVRAEKQNAIQSMDLVYERAMLVGGFLHSMVESREQFQAMDLIGYLSVAEIRDYDSMITDIDQLQLLADGLEILNKDEWFSRSWILQEASLAHDMQLLLRRKREVTDGRTVVLEVSIQELGLRGFMAILMEELNPLASSKIPTELLSRLRDLAGRFHFSRPLLSDDLEEEDDIPPRPVCNTAEAVYYLRHCQNAICSDRIPIIANLCDYLIRINTANVDDDKYSLSVAIFTLALLNGDLSLLVAIDPQAWEQNCQGSQELQYFSWIPPASFIIEQSNWSIENSCTCRLVNSSLTSHGLVLSGFRWCVDRPLAFPALQEKYRKYISSSGEVKMAYQEYRSFFWDLMTEMNRRNLPMLVNAVWDFARGHKFSWWHKDWIYDDDTKGQTPNLPKDFQSLQDPETGALHENYIFVDRKERKQIDPARFVSASYRVHFRNHHEAEEIGRAWKERDENRIQAGWIVSSILNHGILWCGRPWTADPAIENQKGDERELAALFDVAGPTEVLTPYCTGITEGEYAISDKIKLQRMSWIVQSKSHLKTGSVLNKDNSEPTTLITRGMVRGMWNTQNVESKKYILA